MINNIKLITHNPSLLILHNHIFKSKGDFRYWINVYLLLISIKLLNSL